MSNWLIVISRDLMPRKLWRENVAEYRPYAVLPDDVPVLLPFRSLIQLEKNSRVSLVGN